MEHRCWKKNITLPSKAEIMHMDRRNLLTLNLKLRGYDEDLKAIQEVVRERSWDLYGQKKIELSKQELIAERWKEYNHWLTSDD